MLLANHDKVNIAVTSWRQMWIVNELDWSLSTKMVSQNALITRNMCLNPSTGCSWRNTFVSCHEVAEKWQQMWFQWASFSAKRNSELSEIWAWKWAGKVCNLMGICVQILWQHVHKATCVCQAAKLQKTARKLHKNDSGRKYKYLLLNPIYKLCDKHRQCQGVVQYISHPHIYSPFRFHVLMKFFKTSSIISIRASTEDLY